MLLSKRKTQKVKALGDSKVNITRETFRYNCRISRENTASSISWLHFRHYKLASSSELISEIHVIFCDICATLGFFTPWWSVGLQVILLKVTGNLLIYKLRYILEMEVEYKLMSEYLINKLHIRRGEAEGLISEEVFVSHKYHRAAKVARCKWILRNQLRQIRRPGELGSTYLEHWYDRVIH